MPRTNSNEAWSVPPELEVPLPRRVRLDGIGVYLCGVVAVFFAIGSFGATQVIHGELRRQTANESLTRQLAANGREAEATITDLHIALGHHYVCFEHAVDGRTYSGCTPIIPEHWKALDVGSSLAIRYLPSDPQKASPIADPPNSQNNWISVLPLAGFFLIITGGIATAGSLSILLPGRHLLKRGQPACGVVTSCSRDSKHGIPGYVVEYDFSPSDGGRYQGKAFRNYSETVGSEVTVLHDRRKPDRSTLYPLRRCVWELRSLPENLRIVP